MAGLLHNELTERENELLMDFAQKYNTSYGEILDWLEVDIEDKKVIINNNLPFSNDNKETAEKFKDVIRKQNSYMNMLSDMESLQVKLNVFTNGECWISGVTKEGRNIDWLKCIRQEASELIDSFNWKHWKDIAKEDDIENAKMELVDIIHFVISYSFINGLKIKDAWSYFVFDYYESDIVEIVEKLIFNTYLLDKKYEDYIIEESLSDNNIVILWVLIAQIAYELKFSLEEIYELYITKNVLNIFRQTHGYKENTYIKNWGKDKKEDNVILKEILNYVNNEIEKPEYINSDNKEFSSDNLLTLLEESYAYLNKGVRW